jgi:hypothetical protein
MAYVNLTEWLKRLDALKEIEYDGLVKRNPREMLDNGREVRMRRTDLTAQAFLGTKAMPEWWLRGECRP